MKPFAAVLLAVIFGLTSILTASAQTAESIWLTASSTAYKTGETVIVTVNAASATPIQGFTFQIRYDPACLQSVAATTPISGMNGLSLPQSAGLVDASYASTVPQTINGVLAEVHFTALKGCQTNLTLETAALAIRNESGFAAPLPGVTIGTGNVALNIDTAVGVPLATQPVSASTLPLAVTVSSDPLVPAWPILVLLAVVVAGGTLFAAFKIYRSTPPAGPQKKQTAFERASLHIKRGPLAGKSFVINKLPCSIGRDPVNEICLDDPHIMRQHAQIFTANNGYYLADLGGETFVNGQAVRKDPAMLRPGDVVRLGKSSLLVFGS